MKLHRLLLPTLVLLAPLHVAAAKTTPARWWPVLQRTPGERGERGGRIPNRAEATAVQYLLRAHGQPVIVDGDYGPRTEASVVKFQRRRKMKATGKLDEATWEALVTPCRAGSSGDEVRAVQTLLRRWQINVAVTGKFEKATRAAVLKFQKRRHLAPDGFVGKQTWVLLVNGDLELLVPD